MMLNVTDHILVLLRGIAKGDKTIITDPDNVRYVAAQCKDWHQYNGWIECDIVERLQYELYGEFPLGERNQSDWNRNISKALKLS